MVAMGMMRSRRLGAVKDVLGESHTRRMEMEAASTELSTFLLRNRGRGSNHRRWLSTSRKHENSKAAHNTVSFGGHYARMEERNGLIANCDKVGPRKMLTGVLVLEKR